MPLPGGPSAKFGARYEGKWTVACMLDVMSEQANSIRLEPLGEEGRGVEFWLQIEGRREYFQVKRQRGSEGRWRLADLEAEGVLAAFWNRLASDAEAWCVFVSAHAASPLDELSERARSAQSYEEFEERFLNKKLEADFQQLCYSWSCQRQAGFEALRRIRVRTIDEETLTKNLRGRAAGLVEGDADNATDVLAEFALAKVHAVLTALDIWTHLEERSFRRRDWSRDASVLASVQEATERYLRPLKRSAIGGEEIPRSETEAGSYRANRGLGLRMGELLTLCGTDALRPPL